MSPIARLLHMVGILTAAPLGAVAAQAPSPEAMLSRAVAVLDSAETERGAEMLRQLVAMLPPSASGSLRLTVAIRLAEASWALGQHDSAITYFGQALRQQPFLALDPAQVNPEVVAAFREARRRTPLVGLRVPADTIMGPTERWRLRVAVGQPGTVRLYLSQGSKDSLLVTSG
ncbi:MAG: hypothetical protein HY560_09135, partial [Gemmatimonadetes bacterium]|nr:hypothetical protein [Gemmatimonadota bacterium]